MWSKINGFIGRHKEDVYLVFVIVLVAVLAFGLGRLSVIYGEKGELQILYPENQAAAALMTGEGEYIASKTGTTYFFPWCGNANRIAAGNRVSFKTREAAEAAGYRPGNCSGLTQ